MTLHIAMNSTWYIWPTLQFMPSQSTEPYYWPWLLTLWWGTRGIQLEGKRPPGKTGDTK